MSAGEEFHATTGEESWEPNSTGGDRGGLEVKEEGGRTVRGGCPPPQPEEGKGGAIDWPCMVSPQSYECNVPVRAVDVVNRELAQSKQQFPSK